MNDRPLSSLPPVLAQQRPSEPLAPVEEEPCYLPATADDELDKYDISTLACTD
jgi:hypothetical protein